jgi:hypothetical protein
MPKVITQAEVKLIAEMMRDWPKAQPFKWATICAGSSSVLGFEPTRQALHKKPMLVNAYRAKKKQLRLATEKLSHVTRPASMLDAMERIAKLQEENDVLSAEVSQMAELANRFIYNASIEGLSREKLMAPLPSRK